jgi:hypothetical protein
MAKVKDWLIEMESLAYEAFSKGCTLHETIMHVKRNMKNVDTSYVEEVYYQMERES